MLPAMRPRICVFAWGPPECAVNLPGIVAQIELRVYCAEAPRANKPGSLRRPVPRKLPKGGGRVYIAAQSWEPNRTALGMRAANMSAVHHNGNPGEMILVRANRSNFGRPKGRRYTLAQAPRKRLAACGRVLFSHAMCASFAGAPHRAAALSSAEFT